MEAIFSFIWYLAFSYAMAKIGQKFSVGKFWHYFIPLYNMVLLCRCAGASPLWLFGLCLPIVNFAVVIYLYGRIAARLGKNFWLYGVGSLVLGLGVYIMAWDNSRPVECVQ